jgi:hypothetical protein
MVVLNVVFSIDGHDTAAIIKTEDSNLNEMWCGVQHKWS